MIYRPISDKAIRLFRFVPLGTLFFAAGCGGAGGPAASSPSTGSSNMGIASVSFTGKPHAAIDGASNHVSYVAQAGASYSTLTVNPPANLASTLLLFTREGAYGDAIYTMGALSGTPQLLTHASICGVPTISRSGLIVYLTQVNGNYSIESCLEDGSHLKVVKANILGVPSVSPNGATIAYVDSNMNIWTMPSAGGTATEIYSGGLAAGLPVSWSPNSSQIAFSAKNLSTGFQNLYTMAATGGTPTNVTPATMQGDFLVNSWSPDSLSLACSFLPSSATAHEIVMASLNGGSATVLTPPGFDDIFPVISPDNLKIAFYRSNAGGAAPGIYESDFSGVNPALVVPDPSASGNTGPVAGLFWSFYPEVQTFVGTNGTLSTTPVTGFLLAQNGSQFTSLLTFATTTPSKATIATDSTGSNGGPVILKLGGDAITNISYTNVYNGNHTSLPLTSTTGAIVTLDSATGVVDYVATGSFDRKAPMAVKGAGSVISYSGRIDALYDGNGKDLSPGGASTVNFNATTGKLISFH